MSNPTPSEITAMRTMIDECSSHGSINILQLGIPTTELPCVVDCHVQDIRFTCSPENALMWFNLFESRADELAYYRTENPSLGHLCIQPTPDFITICVGFKSSSSIAIELLQTLLGKVCINGN